MNCLAIRCFISIVMIEFTLGKDPHRITVKKTLHCTSCTCTCLPLINYNLSKHPFNVPQLQLSQRSQIFKAHLAPELCSTTPFLLADRDSISAAVPFTNQDTKTVLLSSARSTTPEHARDVQSQESLESF